MFHPLRRRAGIQLIVADLAGTTVDFGCRAPVAALVRLFARHGVDVDEAQAREAMGLHRRDHIRALMSTDPVRRQWRRLNARDWDDADVEALFVELLPLQTEALGDSLEVLPGAVEAVRDLHARGIRVATTTGYDLQTTEIVLEAARAQGFVPDGWACSSEVPAGRPTPWMIHRLMADLGLRSPQSVLKIGDTVSDIEAGRNAGAWTVGVARTGNLVGLSAAALDALSEEEREARLAQARSRLLSAGANLVVDSFADILDALGVVETRGALHSA